MEKVQKFLDELFIKYTVHANVKTESTFQFSVYAKTIDACAIKVVLFSDDQGPVLAAFAAHDGLDFEALSSSTKRKLQLDSGHRYKKQFQGFSIRHLPPFGRLFHIPMIADAALLGHQKYLIDVGLGDNFIEIDKKGFYALFQGAKKKTFTKSIHDHSSIIERQQDSEPHASDKSTVGVLLNEKTVHTQFHSGTRLPAMPDVAKRLITLKTSEDFELEELVNLIESDPVVSAKIIAYSSSPFFSYQGKLDTVQEAIYHVLGVDLSLNIALALALGQQFEGPMNGPLGAKSIWRHSVYCAALTQALVSKIPGCDIKPGSAYLYGLIHNIGFLALGHVFPKKFATFNKSVALKKDLSLEVLEKNILGVTHAMVGSILVDAWGLPANFKAVIKNHHKLAYSGESEEMVHILVIANALLKKIGVGDASSDEIPPTLMQKYELKEKDLENIMEDIMQWHDNLDALALQLVA